MKPVASSAPRIAVLSGAALAVCVTIGSGLGALAFADETCLAESDLEVAPPLDVRWWPLAVACSAGPRSADGPVGPPAALLVLLSLAVAGVLVAVATRPASGWIRSFAHVVATLGVFGVLVLTEAYETALLFTAALSVLIGAVLHAALPREALGRAEGAAVRARRFGAGGVVALTFLLVGAVAFDTGPWEPALLGIGLLTAAGAAVARAITHAAPDVLAGAVLRLAGSFAAATVLVPFAYDSGAAVVALLAATGVAGVAGAVRVSRGRL